MQQVVTFVGVEMKTGEGQNGPWTLKVYKDAGGNKYQTFKSDIQQVADGLMGQPVSVTYDVETRNYTDRNGQARQGQNNVLTSVEAANGPQASSGSPAGSQAVTAAPVASQGDRGALIGAQWAINAAIELHKAGIAVVADASQLQVVAAALKAMAAEIAAA